MKKTGEILRKAREEKGLSLHEIGLSLKISSKVLKSIEEGDDSQLPAKTFLRGFVQSYANYLHLDSNHVLEVFYEEMGSTRPKPYIRPNENERIPSKEDLAANEPVETPLKTSVKTEAVVTPIKKKASAADRDNLHSLRETKSTKTIVISVIGVLLVGLIIFTKKMIDKYSKEAEVPTSEVAQTMEGATPVNDESVPAGEPPTEATEEVAPAAASGPMTPIASKATTPTQVSSQPTPMPTAAGTPATSPTPKPSPTPVATPSPSPAVSPSPAASVTPSPSPSPSVSPSPKPESNKPVELIVEALDTVEIEYSSPSGKPQKIKLTAEQVHTFKSRSGLKINFSNGGAVNLIMNGKDIGIPGDLGRPIKLSY